MAWGALDWIAERHIEQAVANGELSNLPGEGRPLEPDVDPLVPEDMRNVVRVLRNAGALPLAFEHLREQRDLEVLLVKLSGEERKRVLVKLALLRTQVERAGLGSLSGPRKRS